MLNKKYVEVDEILKRLRKISYDLMYGEESCADLADDLQTLIIELEGKND